MSGALLWFKRVKQDWCYQSKIILSVFDWTIILYILIPFLVFVGISYHSWWYTVPVWMDGLSYTIFFFGCYLISWRGLIRTFMEEADQLYLLQYPKMTIVMRYMGALYSSSIIIMKWVLVFVLLFPLTNHFSEVGIGQFTAAMIYFYSLNLLLTTYKQTVYQYRFFKKLFLNVFVFITLAFLSYLLLGQLNLILLLSVSTVLLGLAIWQIIIYQPQYKTFYMDVEKEQRNKVKFIRLMFTFNPEIYLPKVKKQKKRSLLLWRHSERIYKKRLPENGVTELFIKAFLREKVNIFSYLQLISVTSALIFVTPIWLKWIVFLGFWFFFKEWILLFFKEIIKQNPYLASDYVNKDYVFLAQKRCVKLFVYPGVFIIFLFVGLSTLLTILL